MRWERRGFTGAGDVAHEPEDMWEAMWGCHMPDEPKPAGAPQKGLDKQRWGDGGGAALRPLLLQRGRIERVGGCGQKQPRIAAQVEPQLTACAMGCGACVRAARKSVVVCKADASKAAAAVTAATTAFTASPAFALVRTASRQIAHDPTLAAY